MEGRALSAMKVLDLTQFEAGTTCSGFLGWLGADVIKVEGLKGDQSRKNRSEVPGLDSMYFMLFNTSRRSMTIDLKNPEGRTLFLERLVPQADVVVENFGPGTMENLKLDYPVLKDANPRIIMARIKGFGLSGPYSDIKCFDGIAQAAGGLMSVTGEAGGEPLRAGAAVGDTGTGIHTAGAIMAAYIQRYTTGRGQLVEVSMQEVIGNFMRGRYREHYRDGKPAVREGADKGPAPSGMYRCAPGGPNDYVQLHVHPLIPRMWQGLLRAIGREDLAADPRIQDQKSRAELIPEIQAATEAWAMERPKHEVMRILGGAGVAIGAVNDTGDLLEDPHLNERGYIVDIDHPTRGHYRIPGSPVRLSDSPAVIKHAPLLGQHTDEVLQQFGISATEIADLRARQVVG